MATCLMSDEVNSKAQFSRSEHLQSAMFHWSTEEHQKRRANAQHHPVSVLEKTICLIYYWFSGFPFDKELIQVKIINNKTKTKQI